jgi:hypothetical protein
MSKGQILSYVHLIFQSCDNPLFPPYLGGGVGEILRRPCLSPIFRAGWVWVCGWLGPPLSIILANERVGAGVKGQPLQMAVLHLSYVLSSLSPGPFIPNHSPYSTLTVIASLLVCNMSPLIWVLL